MEQEVEDHCVNVNIKLKYIFSEFPGECFPKLRLSALVRLLIIIKLILKFVNIFQMQASWCMPT